ncbi:MAG: M3 family oligoendopeptidase [Candidatus Paceibacterota bacterium]|jgi:oligoendopeptidase F
MQTKTSWDLTPLFSGLDDPRLTEAEQASTMAVEAFAKRWQDRTDWLENPTSLAEIISDYERLSRDHGQNDKVLYYLWLRSELDQADNAIKARLNQARSLAQKLGNQTQFFGLRLARVTKETQQEFLANPQLASYRHFLESVFANAPYLLTEAEEKILNLQSGVSYGNWVQMTEASLAKEEREVAGQKRGFAEITGLVSKVDEKIRREAVGAFDEILGSKIEMAEAEINSVLENKKIDDELRHTTRPDQLRHLSDDIETEVVDAMIKAVKQNYQLAHDFYQLKARLLKKDQLAYHERGIPFGTIGRHYEFDEAVTIVGGALKNLDEDLNKKYEQLLTNGQVDVLPKTSKSGGAFCAGESSISLPTYILLNYTGEFRDVMTLAHEMGHGLNNELIREKQNELNFGTPTSTAEVASTLVELIVSEEIETKTSNETRLAMLMARLDDEIGTIFRQVAAYTFEQQLHEDFRQAGFLSADNIGKLFRQKMSEYLGPAINFEDQHEKWWIHWSHFRRYFYVYSYASGLLIAKALHNKLREDKNFITQIKEILSAGTSASPREIFSQVGLDITAPDFWQKGLEETARDIKQAEELATKLGII